MIDNADALPAGAVLRADVCIIGAGPAGIALALSLGEKGVQVLLLESGSDKMDPAVQQLYAGTVEDARLHSPADRYRMRRFGGSSTVWGGRCMPFDAIDFEQREYIPNSGWPIGLADVEPYYPAANRWCEAGDFLYDADTASAAPLAPMIERFEGTYYSANTLERFSCPTDFGSRYSERLRVSPHVRLVFGANAIQIQTSSSKRTVDRLKCATLSGKAFTATADRFVMAVGGIETVRLLLNSPGASGRGVGNTHDVVGRYYMCHIAGTIGTLRFQDTVRIHHGYGVDDEGVYCRRRLALKPPVQRRFKLANMVARLHHPRMTDPRHRTGLLSLLCLARFMVPYEYAKRLYGDEKTTPSIWFAHLRNVLLDIPGVVGFLWHWMRDRSLAARKFPSIIVHPKASRYSLDFHAEQVPHRDSRILLGAGFDALGMRQVHVDWRYTPQDVDTVKESLRLLASDLQDAEVGAFEFEEAEVESEMTRYGAYGGHHIGTARMGHDPNTSVVDSNCKVHETDNLYVAGSAVFPTSSQANPTLTIVALALRLSDHLAALKSAPATTPYSAAERLREAV